MIEIYNIKPLRCLKINAITIGSIIIYSLPKDGVSERLRRHEQKHVEQYKRDGFIRFLYRYIKEYIRYRLDGFNHYEAYYYISYEVEAREAEEYKEITGQEYDA